MVKFIGGRQLSESFRGEVERRDTLLRTLPGYADLEIDRQRGEHFLPYEEAKRVVQAAGIKTSQEFQKWKRPTNIPSNPARVYLPWPGMSEFLGTGRPRIREFLPYAKASAYMQQHTTVRTGRDFETWKERPHFIPCNPRRRYARKGWKSWEDFLGKNYKPVWGNFLSYEEVRALAIGEGIKTRQEYLQWKDKPSGMPAAPEYHFKLTGEWKGWGEFLGTGALRYKTFWSFKKARAFVKRMGIKTRSAYERVRQSGLPRHPEKVYEGKGWRSTQHFFGLSDSESRREASIASKRGWEKYRALHGDFMPYEEARALVQKLGIKNRPTYQKRRPKNLPCNPDTVYKGKGWQGARHFYGRSDADMRRVRSEAARRGWKK